LFCGRTVYSGGNEAMRTLLANRDIALVAALLVVLACLPLLGLGAYGQHIVVIASIWAIVAASWDLTLGVAGIFNFAHVAFFGLGVYAYGISTTLWGWPSVFGLIFGGVVAIAGAALVSLPTLRLKGIYVVLVTFAFGQLVVQLVVSQSQWTGGAQGMVFLPSLAVGSVKLSSFGKTGYYYVSLAAVALTVGALVAIARSRFGQSVVALKEHEDYAVARGISLARQRFLVLALSAAPAGLAGAIYASFLRVASTEVFGFGALSQVLSMILVGGAGTITGPVLAAFLLTIATEEMSGFGPVRFMAIAVLIVVIVLFYPGGLNTLILRERPARRTPSVE
jgi:branched-chain amino acid transport system permease protein